MLDSLKYTELPPCNTNFQIFYQTFMWVNNMLITETRTYLQFT